MPEQEDTGDQVEWPENPDPAPDFDEAAALLQKRDKAFLFRFGIRVAVAVLFGLWVFFFILEQDVGSCAARGFEGVTTP